MNLILLSIILISSTFELVIINSVINFLNQKVTSKTVLLALFSATLIILSIILGVRAGMVGTSLFKNQSAWFGSSILFVLSFKYLYEGIRLKTMRKTINPLDNKGFILLLISPITNTFFIGIAIGLSHFNDSWYLYIPTICLVMSLIGVLVGSLLKRLISFKYEILISIVLLASAILLVINN